MRKFIYIIFLLSFQLTFSQIKNDEIKNFNTTVLQNINFIDYQNDVDSQLENFFSEIEKIEAKDIQKNSEGKFGLDVHHKKLFNTKETSTQPSILYKNKININSNLVLEFKEKFITDIIAKKLAEEIEKHILTNEALTYGDRNIEFYRNYTDLQNKLLIKTLITPNIELQIGKDIYPYLNKILKTELDKTLQNSLNLFAINF
jgi:hypothetical protein